MPRLRRSTEAEENLIEIWLHIAKDNPAAADEMLRHIDEKFVLLAANPKFGRASPELREGMRRWPIGQYLILILPVASRLCASSMVSAISNARAARLSAAKREALTQEDA